MDSMDAKTELLTNHFTHSLHELIRHYTETGNVEALQDIRRLVESLVDEALTRIRPFRRLEQQVVSDPETGRVIR